MKTHVVHIVRQFAPCIGGLEDSVLNLCKALNETDSYRASVVTLDRPFQQLDQRLPPTDIIEGVPVTRIPFWGHRRYPIAPGVLKAIQDADIVHVHAIDFFFDFLALTKAWHRKPLFASTHGGFFHTPFASGLKKIFFKNVTKRSARAYQKVFASSYADEERFRQITPDNLTVIENGVDVQKWHNAASATPERRMIYIGRWAAHKGLPQAIELLAELRKLHPAWHLTIAGVPSELNGQLLLAKADLLAASSGVTVLQSPTNDQLRAEIGSCTYFISLSEYEGFGISLVEALSAGLVPILRRIPAFERTCSSLPFAQYATDETLGDGAEMVELFHKELEVDSGAGVSSRHESAARCVAAASAYAWESVIRRYLQHYAI